MNQYYFVFVHNGMDRCYWNYVGEDGLVHQLKDPYSTEDVMFHALACSERIIPPAKQFDSFEAAQQWITTTSDKCEITVLQTFCVAS